MNGIHRTALAFVCAASLVAACADDSSGGVKTTSLTTLAGATTTARATTSTAATTTTEEPTTTEAPTTTAAGTTTTGGPTTTLVCAASKDTPTVMTPVVVNYPAKLGGIYGDDIDTGGHICFERVVINFSGTGDFPGFQVQYEKDPLKLGASGQAVDLKGDANLVIFAGSWMGEEGNYTADRQIFPTNVSNIKEVTLLDNSESVMIWGIGLDKERPFKVFKLADPDRLVVDIATDEP